MGEAFPPPRQVGPERSVSLTGLLFAVRGPNMVLVNMFGDSTMSLHLPLFAGPEQLREVLHRVGIEFDGIKQVEDGHEFLQSVPPDIVVVTNLRFTPEGKTRYTQVQR